MSIDHTLSQRLVDARLEAKIWFVATLVTPPITAAGGVTVLITKREMPSLWLDYQIARALDFVGLANITIPGWQNPAAILEVVPQHLTPAMLIQWDGDLSRIAAAGGVGLAVVGALFILRALGFSLNRATSES